MPLAVSFFCRDVGLGLEELAVELRLDDLVPRVEALVRELEGLGAVELLLGDVVVEAERGHVLAALGARLLDLRLRRHQVGLAVRRLALGVVGVELDDGLARLHEGAVLRQERDLLLAPRLGRDQDRRRLHRLQRAARFDLAHEAPRLHLRRSRHRRAGSSSRSRRRRARSARAPPGRAPEAPIGERPRETLPHPALPAAKPPGAPSAARDRPGSGDRPRRRRPRTSTSRRLLRPSLTGTSFQPNARRDQTTGPESRRNTASRGTSSTLGNPARLDLAAEAHRRPHECRVGLLERDLDAVALERRAPGALAHGAARSSRPCRRGRSPSAPRAAASPSGPRAPGRRRPRPRSRRPSSRPGRAAPAPPRRTRPSRRPSSSRRASSAGRPRSRPAAP